MKIGSAVVGLHIAVLCVFALTQGCVTSESQGSGRGAGARHKGPFKHEHKDVDSAGDVMATTDPYYTDDTMPGDAMYGGDQIQSSDYSVEPQPPVSTSGSTEIYIVQKGDMLSQLAIDFDTTTATLVEMNGLSNPDVLYVGQELAVPAGRGASKATTSKSTGSIKKGGTYTIQKGDTLSGIALAAGVGINDLRSLNNIKGDKIMAGDTLDIPSYGKVPSSSRTSSSTKKAEPAPTPVEPAQPVVDEAPMMAPPVTTSTPDEPMSLDVIEDKVLYPGETLDDVARQYGVSKGEIMRLNNISNESQVQEGQRLRIPIAE
ncbi:Autolysin [Pontiella desulfatans]|uniref:Autolysin n=1 Tax=Pontiella desulfatans TaxID=2750659 RepID=A0A6C2TV82_PONDE|nr:LysM peptidoglycan-binding domain-containing protein [Pontiella desulfatans]VGO11509.1 Autolysin [Pontiella desulfatans]